MVKVTDSWFACHELEPSTDENPQCRGERCTLNMSRLNRPPDGVVWKLGEKEIVGTSGDERVPTRGKPGLERPGRPRGERIVRQALVDPTVTRSTIREDVSVAIVPQTISRHLAETNIKSKRPFRALPLTPEHRQLRLQWCHARSVWNVTDWQNVVFSGESRFVLGTDDNRVRVWRRPGERYNSPTLFYVTLPAQLV
ncbi:HTH_Tnp_Tc3_2 domain-containing protein [Trichonephila clavipes]|nr:HTH_Tnp_Tc3_2 domain-containing protein [Trichonephila clavipes]